MGKELTLSSDQMSDGFLRQRRNIMLSSCILIFIKFSEFQIKKVSLLGISFENLGNPTAVYVTLWILFFYFLFRYYQYFMQEGFNKVRWAAYQEQERRIKVIAQNAAKVINEKASYQPQQLVSIQKNSWEISVSFDNAKNDDGELTKSTEEVTLNSRKIFVAKLISWLIVCINSSVITDYILPYALVFLAVFYCFSGGEASLLSTLQAFK